MFFSSVAHELRTPLNSIIPMGENLKKYVHGERGLMLLKIILNSAFHLQSVIEDALDMSRIENNKFEINFGEFEIRKIIEEVADIMSF